jgi:membrane-associated phospholipid phosphatase
MASFSRESSRGVSGLQGSDPACSIEPVLNRDITGGFVRRFGFLLVLFAIVLGSHPARLFAAEGSVRPFSRNEKIFLGGTALVLGVLELHQEFLTPKACRWCEPNDVDDFFRDRFRRSTLEARRTSARWSDVTGFGSGFLLVGWTALAAHGGNHDEIEANTLTVIESAVIGLGVDHVVKRVFARQRPLLRNADGLPPEPDDNLSFYSGHTTLAFSVAAAAGRMADLQGYDSAPAIWVTGMTLAAATGYLRMASDKHYFSDVVVGALTGTAVGLIVANHRKQTASAEAARPTKVHLVFRTDGRSLAVGIQ